jgi:tetratricopeptide (TPR) repeat protein
MFRDMFRSVAVTSLFALACAHGALAQSADEWLKRADQLENAGQTREALAALMEADKLRPDRPEILIRIAKQHGDLMTETKDRAQRRTAAATALALSRKALELDPKSGDAHLAVAISLGKKTEFMGNREKIEVSREIRKHAESALKLNPRCDYAHHMLGRWHQELADVGGATRALARVIYGGLPKASFDDAVKHFERARALRPDRLIHEIEHGRTLAMMERDAEARSILTAALEKPNRDKDDAEAKERGKATLREIN